MHIVLTHEVSQSKREEGIKGSTALLQFINESWVKYKNTRRATMSNLSVPKEITSIIIDGVVYEIGKSRRSLWFYQQEGGRYNPSIIFVSEVFDAQGHAFQLKLACSLDGTYEDFHLIHSRLLDAGSVRIGASMGPSPRID